MLRMDLRAPLFYTETRGLDPFNIAPLGAPPVGEPPPPGEAGAEYLFCFELDPEQSRSIEPEPDNFLGRLVFSGRNDINGQGDKESPASKAGELPAGLYLFTQRRRACRRGAAGREEFIAMAIEQQKDGLWERYKPGDRLFLRLLYEDGGPVTQLFRPIL